MIQMIIILLVLVVVVYVFAKTKKNNVEEDEVGVIPDADCCGAHDVCEKDSLLNADDQVIYFDDEHLDMFKEKESSEYNDDEIEEFREVLYTLRDEEVALWLKSLMLRLIDLPSVIRDEALMIVEERRMLSK